MISIKLRLITALSVILLLACIDRTHYPVSSIAKETFFDANLDDPFDKVQEYFSNHDQLKPRGGFTAYPPLSALAYSDSTSYEVADHPLLNGRGLLYMYPAQGLARPELLFLFKSFAEAKKFYRNYVSRFPGSNPELTVPDEKAAEFTSEEIVNKKKIAVKVSLKAVPELPGYEVRIIYIPNQQ